jgi:diphthine synthase
LARVGQDDQLVVSGTMEELLDVDFGAPLHCLVLPAQMHFIEKECYELFKVKK